MPFITSTTTSASDFTTKGCIKVERDTLLAFKAQIIYSKAHPMSSWGDQTDDCCQWTGVRCDNNSGHVIRLSPHFRQPPPYYYYDYYYYNDGYCNTGCTDQGLSGNISESLIGLQHLKHLDLSFNCFNNIPIPKLLGSFENLVHLDLRCSGFTGAIPHQLGNLTRLIYLDLATDYYEGVLKVDDAEWLSGLSSLRYLSMDGANFSGVNNVIQSLNKLQHLEHVSLLHCRVSNIPESLPHLNFTSLAFLNIGWNNFMFGTNIPEWLFRIPKLRFLNMIGCMLSGTLHSSVGNATSLQFLDLSLNIFDDMPRGFGDLCNLRYLHLGIFMGKSLEDFKDAFSGCIRRNLNVLSFEFSMLQGPLPDWLGEFRNLTILNLSYNSFNGSIPGSLGRLLGLQYLGLSDNELNGPIPESLWQLSNLVSLGLGDNNYSSVITEAHLANLTNLKYLLLDRMVLNISNEWIPGFQAEEISLSHCHIGTKFPIWLANQVNLQTLDISNVGIRDSMPDWLWNIIYTISFLDLSNNEISGRLPQHLKFQAARYIIGIFLHSNRFEGCVPYFPPNVHVLDLSNNSLSGIIPSDLGNFGEIRPQLTSLRISSNNLIGNIPKSLCNFKDLVSLELSNNHLEGVIPSCWNNLMGLQYLILANNSLTGEVLNSLTSSSQSLRVLYLSNNRLHGDFPSFLEKCTSMTTLALDHNNLSGEIPTWVGETMTSLMILTLKENNFSGNLPLLSNLTSLHFLDLSHNSFVGSIPQSYGNLTGMIDASMNGGASFSSNLSKVLVITLTVATKGIDLQYGVILSSLKFMDLSANKLSGTIPKEIVNLVRLQNLDLSCNYLSGEIPSDIGLMQSLESLDLSRNELIGSIPLSLSTINFLESLNLSHNNLSGKIPYVNHLTTFNNPSSYVGNLNLCGAPLEKNCTSDEPPSNAHNQEDEDDNDSQSTWFYIGLMPGFVVGFWIVWGILLFKKEWGCIYFKFLDHTYDMIYVKIVVLVPKIKRALAVTRSM
ncbi:receptor-like protein EIX1 [Dioscorea cayenensis subsp. rotundata]|uniref:Receptor-like protein EIX1 n=1 Tax=Dioscorea cayennensis subsp. rotundata TaxID=55577 RepID=A0AB40C8B5_DIOCR|nr:receptor-like protein EIX1 [Dioscorea cayenensis subsp. rotundata]